MPDGLALGAVMLGKRVTRYDAPFTLHAQAVDVTNIRYVARKHVGKGNNLFDVWKKARKPPNAPRQMRGQVGIKKEF